MKFFGGEPGWRRTVATAAALAVVAGVPVTFAVLHEGFPVSDVKLNVKDVWVTNSEQSLAGRLNRQIDELTAATESASTSFDVEQDGGEVFLHDQSNDTLQRIERSRTTLVDKTPVPADAEISLAGTTMSVLDPASGKLWVINVANGLSFDSASTPTAKLGANANAVVSRDGTVFATSPSQSKLYEVDGAGALPTTKQLAIPADNQLSSVGETPVILDAAKGVLITGDGKRVTLPGKAERIQQPGATTTSALVATADGLLRVPLSGGSPQVIQANIPAQTSAKDVAAPVYLDGCVYGAWSGAQRYVQQCDGGVVQRPTIAQATEGHELEFRVNQHVIALNDLQNGNSWILSSKLLLVKNWDEVRPPVQSKVTKGHQKSTEESFEDTLAHRTAINHPPIARPDEYGVRPGRTTILPVADNDTDQDGDILVVSKFPSEISGYGHIDSIDGGRALQFTPTSNAAGGRSFSYTISDGRGGSASTSVGLDVVSDSTDHAPKELRNPSVSVESGQSVTYNVLADWTDPDGDDIELKSATPTTSDVVRFTPDGQITFHNTSGQIGTKTVDYVVTDGKLETSGKFIVNVKASGSLTPVGVPDFAQIFAGQSTVIKPLDNDIAPNGKPLKLLSLSNVPSSATVVPGLSAGTVSVASSTPGVIYLTYAVGGGDERGEGIIRVDVEAVPKDILPPIAVKDVGYLRAGQSTTVKVLSNDVSPEGRVLSVQSVETTNTDQALKVELLNNTVVRLTAPTGLTTQTQFTYTISDGRLSSTAGVTVVPVAPIVNRQPPMAKDDDDVVVRAGDIVSVPVMDNDTSPDQEQLFLEPKLADISNAGGGLAFVNGDTVRYQAPAKPGQYWVVYRIEDQYGESSTAKVTFTVTAVNKATDRPPAPTLQTARAFTGQTIRINVPLDGIDPDGDSSYLTGIDEPPLLGTIVRSGPTWFDYKANSDASGTDVFKYNVADSFGKVGVGEIDVGVIPHGDLSAQPNAVEDSVEVKPGKTVSTQVLANDSDPNGYPLKLSKKLNDVSPVLTAHVTGNKVIITAPKKQGEYTLAYSISNGQGGIGSANVIVKVTKTAKPMYPTATDDDILNSRLHGASPIKVNIEPFINNPNGEDSDLVITAEGLNAERADIDQNAGTITVTPTDERYAVAYRVTDPNTPKLSATAFIVVPPQSAGANTLAPTLKATLPRQIVKENSFKVWKLSDILTVPSGKPAIITSANTVHATHNDGASAYVDNRTLKFVAQKNYRGNADIVFQVTDGSTASDPSGHVAYLTLPITVGDPSSSDVAPKFTLLKLPIQAGEKAKTVDLRDSTSDPNRSLISQFSYGDLSGQTGSISASLSGPNLVVSSPLGVQPGATATLHFTIRYKQFAVPGEVQVTVVKSTRPLAQAVTDNADGQRGQTIGKNVLANDINPYADVNKPLRLQAASIENAGASAATLSTNPDGLITVHPGPSFIGIVSIVYTVRDASNDPGRDVKGRFLLNVRDVPDAPTPPSIVSQNDKAVEISWQAPATNGADILDYTITTHGGSVPQLTVPASKADATITGLTNGADYTFSISARNELGDGASSGNSATAIPFGKPGAPGSPSISASSNGSGLVTMTWGAANGNGRDVSSYNWTLSDGQHGSVGGLSATATGHVGTSYSFTVTATNPAGPGAGATSGSDIPTPGAPSSATATAGAAGDTTVALAWGAAPSNEPITKYEINVNGGGWTSEGTSRSTSVTGAFDSGTSFQVRAYSGGQVSAVTTSNTAVPRDVPKPSYSLCYGAPYQTGSVQHFVGVNYANISGTITLKLQGGFTSHTTIVGGSGQWISASHIARQTSGDLNQTVTLLGNGSPVLSERWGDAPPC